MAAAAGEDIPLGWAVDADGKPTTDPKEALKGSLVSSGGYKGYGFGLMAEVLAAAVTGSVNSVTIKTIKNPEGPPHDLGQFYLMIDPSVHAGDGFYERIEILSDAVTSQEGARLPGSKRVLPDSVELDPAVWELTQTLARGPQ